MRGPLTPACGRLSPGLVAGLLIFLSSCAPGSTAVSAPATDSGPHAATGGAPPAGWQLEWDRALAAARQEGVVVVDVPPGQLWRDWALTFETAHPGIKVDVSGLIGRDFVPRILTERRGGAYLWDVYVGGPELVI